MYVPRHTDRTQDARETMSEESRLAESSSTKAVCTFPESPAVSCSPKRTSSGKACEQKFGD
jgi:hypothetical protein